MTSAPDIDWSPWVPVLEKVFADLRALNAYLRGKISHKDYCRQVGSADDVAIAAECIWLYHARLVLVGNEESLKEECHLVGEAALTNV